MEDSIEVPSAWEIVGGSLNPNTDDIEITAAMADELNRMKSKLIWKMVRNYVGVGLEIKIGNKHHRISNTPIKTMDTEIKTQLQTDIGQIQKEKGNVYFKYDPTKPYYILTNNGKSYHIKNNSEDENSGAYKEAMSILTYAGVMTTGLLAAAGVGAWQLSKKRRYWK